MNLSSGYPLWFIRNGLPFDYPKLLNDIRCDVVVIGGGISGALTALALQQAGKEVVVVDGRTIGLGSTCASTALLQYELDIPLCRLREMIGQKKADRAYQRSVQSIHDLKALAHQIGFSNFQTSQSIYYAANERDIPLLLAELDARKSIGINASWLDETDLMNQYGLRVPAAIISEPAAQTNAYAFTHAVHQYAIGLGAQVYDNSFIKKVVRRGKGFHLITADDSKLECSNVVFANGYEVTEHLDQSIVALSSTYTIASEQLFTTHPLLEKQVLVWSTGNPYLYLRTTSDKRIVIGGRDEPFHSAARRDKLVTRKARWLVRDAAKLVPDLPIELAFAWTGTFGSTKDNLPFIGSLEEQPGIYYALGFGGNGISFSQIASTIVTNAMLGKPDPDASLFAFQR